MARERRPYATWFRGDTAAFVDARLRGHDESGCEALSLSATFHQFFKDLVTG